MQTSGLLIHITSADFDSRAEESLGAREGLTLGVRLKDAYPAVLEAVDGRSSIDVVRDLERMPGVGRVDVVFVGTNEAEEGDQ